MNELNAYCVMCRESKTTKDFEIKKTDSDRYLAHGICPTCGTSIKRLLSGKVIPA